MKKLLLTLSAAALLCGFAACSDNDETGKDGIIHNKERELFIGTWSGYGQWTFNADETCFYSYGSRDYQGTWDYEPKTQTLITDISEWNWHVISIKKDQWVGTHLAGKKGTYTYTRVN